MCERCEGLRERFSTSDPFEYKSLARQLDDMVKRGSLRVVSQSASLAEIVSSPTWPGDGLQNTLACTTCGQMFQLSADAYHRRAGWAGAMDFPRPNPTDGTST